MLKAPWDLSPPFSSCLFLLSLPGLFGGKVSQMVLQGHKLSSTPFAFHSSPKHCLLFNWLWTCWCASSSCSADARPYKWVWGGVWMGGVVGGRSRNKLANSYACQSAAFRVTVWWWTAEKEQQETSTSVKCSNNNSRVLFPSPTPKMFGPSVSSSPPLMCSSLPRLPITEARPCEKIKIIITGFSFFYKFVCILNHALALREVNTRDTEIHL